MVVRAVPVTLAELEPGQSQPTSQTPIELFCKRLEHILRLNSQSQNADDVQAIAELGTSTASIAVQLSNNQPAVATYVASSEGATPETTFQACSISKSMTALAALRLVDLDLLALDDPITNYLPAWAIKAISTDATAKYLDHVTLRQLLSHTSGFGFHGCHGYANVQKVPTHEQLLAGHAPSNKPQIRLEGLPGQGYAYSGGGYVVVQIMLETLYPDLSFDQIMQTVLFRPLSMLRSSFPERTPTPPYADARYTANTPCDQPFRYFAEKAAAGLWTTPTDILQAVRAIQQSLVLEDGKGFLRRHTAEAMTRTYSSSSYGLGLRLGASMFGHSGDSEPGWTCFFLCFARLPGQTYPSGKASGAIAVMTNSPLGSRAYDKIISAICYIQNYPPLETFGFGLKQGVTPFGHPGAKVPSAYRAWSGAYEDGWSLDAAGVWPSVSVGAMPGVGVFPSCMPCDADGRPFCLSMRGMVGMHIRLVERGSTRAIEVWREDGDGMGCSVETKLMVSKPGGQFEK